MLGDFQTVFYAVLVHSTILTLCTYSSQSVMWKLTYAWIMHCTVHVHCVVSDAL